ncbi:MAG: hypothetical protein OXI81_15410 [Paracoccaceae bacterium]|nr:hypothetical protein [Paracoccaceae bacterium]
MSPEIGGETCRTAETSADHTLTLFGPVAYDRSRYRPSGDCETSFPTGSVLGLTECGLTPAVSANTVATRARSAWRIR